MKVIVDTSVWSLALRRNNILETTFVDELSELVKELRVQMIGPIRQEILSGIRNKEHFLKLRETLRSFPDLEITMEDYERGAEFFNLCRSNGIQGSNTDFLICAVAFRCRMSILTTDKDFLLYRDKLPIVLHRPRFGQNPTD